MATTDLVGPAIGFVAFASVMLCVVGWKRGWCYTEGESGAMRPGAYVLYFLPTFSTATVYRRRVG